MTDVLDAHTVATEPLEACAVLAKVRRYFTSRFAMWDRNSSDEELIMFSRVREQYPSELTAKDLQSVQAECKQWKAKGVLPPHVLAWHQTALDDFMHFPR